MLKPLEKVNLTWDDFGEYMFHRRVAKERTEIANPQGWTSEISDKRLQEMRKEFTPEQRQAMDQAVDAFIKLRQSN
ncbi:MAG: hypothetical protein GWN61_00660, partial [candidate division Zixibacteria bacterium]|nr:hypothetical protein [candidate division Zixibacteria bacterium]NIR62388.1 hypothetical protein [candidate division Zixibacteria bacterium]NIS15031.1 hypothetical protein [candidate division Zixibacteria bacterium]NIS44565.1 hypothetical protein [candidate division Zixibacteria bacterium]NIU12610.1 hypothetical protein [candidate division Zixibacteria bacterium]